MKAISHRHSRPTVERTGRKAPRVCLDLVEKTIHGLLQFQKPTSLRLTWESPGGENHNEIDHIIVNRRYCLTDVGVVPKFYTGSDHRLLCARFFFSRKEESREVQEEESQTNHQLGSFHYVIRLLGRYHCREHR
ncbi:hypothetical protein Y032_0008g136 [Ancylostoma ceylanicum]|uniref:Endonuclease/exonuclease/phosphatase domain-containing protein n=1 Tax=Ancylostoma ceylanicum TaxID=53326 RepID=A0A016VJB5_9BILA|nr:hypothetical protein Y032_0008g136 [Ancylostoma ceylanicum]